ncbi:hypothetical protein CC85DRAFT_281876 [Cutaneotrichosporon oleaginosum]|uniref:Uncharacterized protein n=1 Tax=Cutaneotrichosporon oleaginosum TaxID=879819 RepID=A0A0J1BDS2_9TREE|nr:uncharacterized protein CC85DRAFT_281876 [Cutaneotrichosporon oleaginosum]KLT46224.1 hypothetical protein CC85DRAFT_281876 [Cutaneotrichosporon oleaginosum]TXT10231.1 hypothetical protein COLE_04165 [Cutaneotrichosporon oleaginosum]
MAGDFNADGAAKYQFVVVAIVACGVFAAGVITVMYRRRRQRILAERMGLGGFQGRTRLLLSDGVIIDMPPGRGQAQQPRKKRPKLGPEPKLWDVEVGDCVVLDALDAPEQEDSDMDSFESSIDEGTPMKGKGVNKLDVDEWQPVAINLPPHPPHNPEDPNSVPPPHPNADITLLIAMPSQSLSCPPDDGQLPLLHLPPSLCPRDADDFEDGGYSFPSVQLGSTNVRVEADWADLDALKPPKPPKPPRTHRPRRRYEPSPIEGFTRGLFRNRAV